MNEALLIILGAVLGWIGQWLFYRYQQRDKNRQGPNVVIAKISRNGQILCEIRNLGPDSLGEMDVTIKWLADGHIQTRPLNQFFSPQQDERTATASHVQLLGPRDHYILIGLPQQSEDGIVDVEVAGLGVTSQRLYTTRSQIDVALAGRE